MTWKLYAVVSAGAFVATYLASGPATAPARVQPSTSRPTVRQTSADVDIQALAERLEARVRAETSYSQPGRDPFRFVAPHSAPRASRPFSHVVETPVSVIPPAPLVTLAGIATDRVNGTMQKTAILSTPANVLIVREGDMVGGIYRVVAIEEEAVELEATADGSRRTLRFPGKNSPFP